MNSLVPARERSAPLRVTGRLKVALDTMVWQGAPYAEAAQSAGLTARAMRKAMQKQHVLAYLRAERQTLLASEGPRTVHRLAALRDQSSNMNAAVQACRTLEGLPDEQGRGSMRQQVPGLVIQIISPSAPPRDITPGPVIEHETPINDRE